MKLKLSDGREIGEPWSPPIKLPFLDPATTFIQATYPLVIDFEIAKVGFDAVEKQVDTLWSWELTGKYYRCSGRVYESLTKVGISQAPVVIAVGSSQVAQLFTASDGSFNYTYNIATSGRYNLTAYLFRIGSPIYKRVPIWVTRLAAIFAVGQSVSPVANPMAYLEADYYKRNFPARIFYQMGPYVGQMIRVLVRQMPGPIKFRIISELEKDVEMVPFQWTGVTYTLQQSCVGSVYYLDVSPYEEIIHGFITKGSPLTGEIR